MVGHGGAAGREGWRNSPQPRAEVEIHRACGVARAGLLAARDNSPQPRAGHLRPGGSWPGDASAGIPAIISTVGEWPLCMVTNPFLRLALQVEGDRHSGLSYNNEGRLIAFDGLIALKLSD